MGDSFKLPHKQPSLEDLRGWRKGVITRNPARRFRYTADVNKRREAQDMIKVAFLATKALFVFLDKAFLLTANHLEGIQERPGHYKKLGGAEGIAAKLGVDSFDQGILGTEDDITKRIKVFGLNMYDEKPPKGFWLFVWEASQDLTLIVLVVCAIVSLAVGIPTEGLTEGWYDGVGILVSIFIVVFVTATSDYRQSLQFRNLEKEKKKIKVQVVRGGRKMTVFIQEIVVGDIVHLSTGDQIPADGIFLSGYSLTIDQSSLTGESEPVHPSKDEPFLLSGSMVVNGTGRMLVTAVGMRTEWGKLMSKLSEGGDNETPLQVRLNGVATTVGKIGLAFAFLTFIVLLVRFFVARFEEGFTWRMEYLSEIVNYFAIAVTILVVAVPEGLPLAVTLSLAYAMKQMIADKALVRNLSSCETMGSATCICSDKTGTLTSNRMTVVKVCCAGCVGMAERVASNLSETALKLLLGHIFLNTAGDIVETAGQLQVQGTPTEAAILEFGLLLGGDFHEVRSDCEILQVEPFSSATKKMSVLVKLRDGGYRSYCKGASEIVLRMCKYRMDENGFSIPLDSVETQKLENVIAEFAKGALRTLCLAYVDFDSLPQEDVELSAKGMTCLAIIGIKDPIRPGVKNAVNLCFKAGIQVRMVTGDNIETAKAIARECNILTNDGLAVEGPDFRQWSLTEMLEKVPKVQVIARSSPFDKLMLVQHLKNQQEVVAVTGDGTNDAPALHEADIGLAMGIAGTEVARSSADVIILDDNFTTIVNVAKWGRSVYTNIQKFVQFQLTVNVVALIINFVSACVTGDAPLTAVQLLWVNLIMDTLGALALATEAPYDALMERPPVGRKGTFITNVMWRNIFGQALYQLAVLWVLQFQGGDILNLTGDDAADELRTMIFNSFVFLQVFNEINSREMEKLNVFSNILTNKVFLGVMLSTVAFQIVIVEFLGRLASTVPLNALQWAVSVGLGFFSLFVAFLVKLIPVPNKPLSEIFSNEENKDGYTALP